MKPTRALKLAIEAMKHEHHRFAVDANLAEFYGADYPEAINALKKRKELQEAILLLEQQRKDLLVNL